MVLEAIIFMVQLMMCTSAISNLFLPLKEMIQFSMNLNGYIFLANRNTLWNDRMIDFCSFYESSLSSGPCVRHCHRAIL